MHRSSGVEIFSENIIEKKKTTAENCDKRSTNYATLQYANKLQLSLRFLKQSNRKCCKSKIHTGQILTAFLQLSI